MKKAILSILFLSWIFTFCALEAAGPSFQVYYKNQGYTQLVEANKESSKALKKIKDQGDREHVLNLATIFMAQVLNEHPDYLDRYAQNFSKLSFYEKAIFLRGICSAEMDHHLLETISDRKLKKLVNDPNLILLSTLDDLQVRESGDLDYLWSSFFATGNETYIQQMIEIVNRDDELLLLAYEWINRKQLSGILSSMGIESPPDYSDLQEHIEMRSRDEKDYPIQFSISAAAFWSLNSNSAQDPTIKEVILGIVQADPSLDFWKKIDTAIH